MSQNTTLRSFSCFLFASGAVALIFGATGCPAIPDTGPLPGIVPTDQTFYIGSDACSACHANVADSFARHGHAQALKRVNDGPPVYPDGQGVPTPPAGFNWNDISYVAGGYQKSARFVDLDGFVLTDGRIGANSQYNPAVPAIGVTAAGFAPYLPAQIAPLPFEFDEFRRITTGPRAFNAADGQRQDNRPGIQGTWAQAAVTCEACHGPGSRHIPEPQAGNIELNAGSSSCTQCHANPGGSEAIAVTDGLIDGYQQVAEVAASPHAGFACTFCHDPHTSANLDPAGIRNNCTACHPGTNMALHEGLVYRRGDYVEPVTCQSCHMPYLVRTGQSNDLVLSNGRTVRLGDTRSHIFRLDPGAQSEASMFASNGTEISRDADGQSAVSTCFVCQRCHNGLGNAFAFPASQGCAFGSGIHGSQ